MKKIDIRMNLGNVCYNSVQNILSSRLLSKNIHTSFGCITCSITLGVEHKLRVFEDRVLSRIFGTKIEKVPDGWRKLHKEGRHNFYASPNTIRVIKSGRMREAGHVARMARMKKMFGQKTERKRPLGRPKRK
jgi:hypothetical protein